MRRLQRRWKLRVVCAFFKMLITDVYASQFYSHLPSRNSMGSKKISNRLNFFLFSNMCLILCNKHSHYCYCFVATHFSELLKFVFVKKHVERTSVLSFMILPCASLFVWAIPRICRVFGGQTHQSTSLLFWSLQENETTSAASSTSIRRSI